MRIRPPSEYKPEDLRYCGFMRRATLTHAGPCRAYLHDNPDCMSCGDCNLSYSIVGEDAVTCKTLADLEERKEDYGWPPLFSPEREAMSLDERSKR